MERESQSPPTVPPKGNGKATTLTGFVLKLYNMVNGAPDDVVSVSFQMEIWNCSLVEDIQVF